jgi:hypothetical protein
MEAAFVRAVESVAGTGNVYVSVNAHRLPMGVEANELRGRRAGFGGGSQDVPALQRFILDLDVDTAGRRRAALQTKVERASSSTAEVKRTLRVAEQIVAEEGITAAAIFASGNGAQVLVPVHLDHTADNLGRLKAFEEEVRVRHADKLRADGLRLDHTWPAGQVMALAGTLKMKGRESEERRYRLVALHSEIGEPATSFDDVLRRRILAMTPAQPRTNFYLGAERLDVPRVLRPLAGWCELWNRILMDAPPAPVEGYSGTIWTLAVRLAHDRVEREDSVRLLRLFDDAHQRKFSSRQNADAILGSVLDRAAHVPLACSSAKALAPDVDLCEGCPWAGKPRRASPVRVIPGRAHHGPAIDGAQPDVEASPPMTLDYARALLRAKLHSYLYFECKAGVALKALGRAGVEVEDEKPSPVLLVRGPPGLGKSTVLSWLLNQRSDFSREDGQVAEGYVEELRFVLLAPRYDRMDELAEDLARLRIELGRSIESRPAPSSLEDLPRHPRLPRTQFIRLYGKLASGGRGLCTQQNRLKSLRNRGFGDREYELGCRPCTDFKGCRYWEQFENKDVAWLMPMQFLGTGRLDVQRDNDPDVYVCDEGILELQKVWRTDYAVRDLRSGARVIELKASKTNPLVFALNALADFTSLGETATGRTFRELLVSQHPQIVAWLETGLADAELVDYLRLLPARALADISEGIVSPLVVLEALKRDFETDPLLGEVRLAEAGTLEVRRPVKIDFRSKPAIILDSSGDAEQYEKMLGREVDDFDLHVPVACDVYQLADGRYSVGTLTNPTRKAVEELLDIVEAIDDASFGGLAVVSASAGKVEPMIRARLGQRVKVYLHYWGLRGTNRVVEDECSDIVLFGTPTPDVNALAADVEMLDGLPHQAAWETAPRRYGFVDEEGNDREVDISVLADPVLQKWLELRREQEMSQAAFRIRPLEPGLYQKRIWILSSLPVPRLPPTKLFASRKEMLKFIEGLPR